MYSLNNLANIVVLRNFLVSSIDNLRIKISKDDLKVVQSRIVYLDKLLIDAAVSPNFAELIENENKVSLNNVFRATKVESGDDIGAVADKVRCGLFDQKITQESSDANGATESTEE